MCKGLAMLLIMRGPLKTFAQYCKETRRRVHACTRVEKGMKNYRGMATFYLTIETLL